MAFVDPTPATFKARFPKFAAVDDAIVQEAIAEAGRRVDQSWAEGDYTLAKMLYAAHVLTMDGFGSGAEASLINEAGFGVKRIKAGDKQIDFAGAASSSSAGSSGSTLGQTQYGIRFKELQRINFAGTRVLTGDGGFVSPNATDYPYAWFYEIP